MSIVSKISIDIIQDTLCLSVLDFATAKWCCGRLEGKTG